MIHRRGVVIALFGSLFAAAVLQVFFSPWGVVGAILGVVVLAATVRFPLPALAGLLLYLPFETLFLKLVPDPFYGFVRFFPEVFIYVLVGTVMVQLLRQKLPWRASTIDAPMLIFIGILIVSAIYNNLDPSVATLGIRQILRFPLLAFVVWYLAPPTSFFVRLTGVLFVLLGLESFVGIAQHFFGSLLDPLLLPSEPRSFGTFLVKGVEQTWEEGERVFATFGRYDRLGNFLAFFLVMAVAFWYELKRSVLRRELLVVLVIGLPALLFTFSRASWFSFLLGALFVALYAYRDKRVFAGMVVAASLVLGYVGVSQLQVRYLTDETQQTVVERFFEAFSRARWRGEYYGFGRLYWMVQTPLVVVPASPLIGHGPGMYGAGAAAALTSTRVYERLGLPFGVYGSEGYIDNNWFSLWGETGTIGVLMFGLVFALLFIRAVQLHKASSDPFVRALAIGFAGGLIGFSFNGGLSTIFEIRTIAPYVWVYGGMILVLASRTRLKAPPLLFERL